MSALINRNLSGSDRLGRYYTHTDISEILVAQMVGLKPKRIIDLGAGAGALSLAAYAKWKTAELLTVDIDKNAEQFLKKILNPSGLAPKHKHVHADALSPDLPKLINTRRHIDVGVCNPPFIIPEWRKGFAEILEDVGFSGCIPAGTNTDAALLFLAQNLRLLSTEGTLGIILPDSLISSSRYRNFRRELLSRYSVQQALRLPRRSFCKTDALAHILIIGKCKPTNDSIPLFRLLENSQLSSPLMVPIDGAIERLDFEFHANRNIKKPSARKAITLGTIGATIKRGSLTSSERHQMDFPTFHTTDMKLENLGHWCNFRRFGKKRTIINNEGRPLVTAEPGDILIARVGRNLEQKIVGVATGFPVLTDCVLKVSVPEEHRVTVLAQLSSKAGRAWLSSRAYGVSAQQISKTDLLEFPLSL